MQIKSMITPLKHKNHDDLEAKLQKPLVKVFN